MQTAVLLLTKITEKGLCADPVLSVLVQHSSSCLKTWVDGQMPEPDAIIKPKIYLLFLTYMKNMKKHKFFSCQNERTGVHVIKLN